jgi:hypothetical protein
MEIMANTSTNSTEDRLMKRGKKVMAIGFVGLLVFGAFIGEALAGWELCTVDGTGTTDTGDVKIQLICQDATSPRSFRVPAGEENRMMSIALTAVTTNMPVRANIDWATPGSEITGLRISASDMAQ